CISPQHIPRDGERPQPAFWLFSIVGAAAVGGFTLYGSDGRNLSRRPADDCRHLGVRPWLCRRGKAFATARRLAGHFLGLVAVPADDGGDHLVCLAERTERRGR